jgi:polyhydroxyalkanoate synthase
VLADTNLAPGRRAPDAPRPGVFSADRDSLALTAYPSMIDRAVHASMARMTGGISPMAMAEAYFNWWAHIVSSPGKQMQLAQKAARKLARFQGYVSRSLRDGPDAEPCIEPLPQDRRFRDEAWKSPPFSLIQQAFLLQQQWWHNAFTGISGVTRHHEKMLTFGARQMLDVAAPSNSIVTNPVVLARTVRDNGMNLVRGFQNWIEDWERQTGGHKPVGAENFVVGRDVAVTPGKVVFRNDLIELIQYSPATTSVHAEPILVVPAWIMKYYILDLSAANSLVRFLVGRGHTVFIISWKNPDESDRDLGMDDYRSRGIGAALDVVGEIVPRRKVHAVGYCLGGTMLAIAAAVMARDGDRRLASLTLLAAQVDFTEAGELTLFTNDSQVAFLEDMMWAQGFLDGRQMAGAFQILRSNDLTWSKLVHDYLMGERAPLTDLMAWNSDATRMPYRMHSEYLRKLFLENDLAEGRYVAEGKPVALGDLRLPMFVVGTEQDHVAPWRSVYKIHLYTQGDITFLLASGGHNAGIVSEPGHAGRTYRVGAPKAEHYVDPDTWLATATSATGSWWTEWADWLEGKSSKARAAAPASAGSAKHRPLCDAPGTYVLVE